jgi:hypothetical protein
MRKIENIIGMGKLQNYNIGIDGLCGYIKINPENKLFHIIFSFGGGWEHVSVSLKNRTPTWNEMCVVKDIFWRYDETVIQYHPAEKDYKNIHPYCLHMWRPIDIEIPKPPLSMV